MAAHAALKKKRKEKKGELIMSVVCGGNGAVTFPDGGDIPTLILRGSEMEGNLLTHRNPNFWDKEVI